VLWGITPAIFVIKNDTSATAGVKGASRIDKMPLAEAVKRYAAMMAS
jgi:hypothetical protein